MPQQAGLGVHLTLDLQATIRFGPDVEWIEQEDYTVDPTRGQEFYTAIRRYWPGLPKGFAPGLRRDPAETAGPGACRARFHDRECA